VTKDKVYTKLFLCVVFYCVVQKRKYVWNFFLRGPCLLTYNQSRDLPKSTRFGSNTVAIHTFRRLVTRAISFPRCSHSADMKSHLRFASKSRMKSRTVNECLKCSDYARELSRQVFSSSMCAHQ
jgi:hypothetical protein